MISPLVGKSIAPHRFSNVDFPHPLLPTNATISPLLSSKETFCNAITGASSLGYNLLTSRTSSSAIHLESNGCPAQACLGLASECGRSLHSECLAKILVTG